MIFFFCKIMSGWIIINLFYKVGKNRRHWDYFRCLFWGPQLATCVLWKCEPLWITNLFNELFSGSYIQARLLPHARLLPLAVSLPLNLNIIAIIMWYLQKKYHFHEYLPYCLPVESITNAQPTWVVIEH